MTRLVDLQTGERIELAEAATVVGRDADLVARIDDREVSRRHAMIRRSDYRFWFYDLGSSNGSFLNGKLISTATELVNGDEISFGTLKFRFETEILVPEFSDSDQDGLETLRVVRMIRAVLFASDIEGYTTLAESMPPDELAALMGKWYAACERILGAGGASIQDFAGDSVFAYWPEATPESCAAALECARSLLDFSSALKKGFGLGVGLHVGDVAAGSMEGTDYRILGDAVNLTFRIEGLTRSLGRDFLVTGEFLDEAGLAATEYESMGEHSVKGRDEKVGLFSPA